MCYRCLTQPTPSVAEAERIREVSKEMQKWLWSHGWNVTLDQVIKHSKWFERWWNKQLSFGYLVHRLGLKRRNGWT